MNSLSWMMYLASVADGLRYTFMVGALAALCGLVALSLLTAALAVDEIVPDGTWRRFMRWTPLTIVALLIGLAVPTSTTIYMIAASEAGEAVVSSPEAKEMLGDLKEIIRKRLKEELNEEVGV